MFYTEFTSASKKHIVWLRSKLDTHYCVRGHITKSRNDSAYKLKYAKAESLKLLLKLYYTTGVICLSRKRLKIEKALRVEGKSLE